jgi:hypothetical protein
MTNVQWLPQVGNPIDLDDNDQEVIIRRARELKGNWGVRFVRSSHSSDAPEPKWAYLFNCGPATDGMPVITITRTTSDYTVISWDILQFLAEGDFSQARTGRISEALDAVEDMASAVVGE